MKNGLEIDAPVSVELMRAVIFAIKVMAVGAVFVPAMYGIARLILAVRWW
ncbi:TPA: hypothetical protein ACY3XX_002107 [Yersinia enterocolitica]|uniref:Uncharacterized protein n=3 Tax=Yersinia enterocolitica TaxID=630 RepID=A0A0E1NBQ4_YEREN|nr:hypothetical protein [Yersinia enterocolitica]CBX73410.1 unknown protein [Yersinia enterocolitica W22703]ADZ43443.1 hypothetical protein YE105_C2949 [Yersinia enterocolitica subsp. palearctica 105.5R(r)]AJJ26578.1 hypothetical protein CH48_468 [Yersinia enterocolitica]ALG79540.1 membrane protein [Yersinia enterocolitica]EHB20802.1 hypothetical protein IOK_10825 [Yersinia enterocolitica subsp. palearctica PhRBD_Ye1]